MGWRALFIGLLLPVQAMALSCLPYGITDAYRDAAEADETYVIVRGTLRFDPGELPEVDLADQAATPALTVIRAEMSGVNVGQKGRRVPFTKPVRLEVRCFGPWCSQPQPGDTLAFLLRKGQRYTLATDPCGGFLFGRPTAAQMRAVQQCLDGRLCPESEGR